MRSILIILLTVWVGCFTQHAGNNNLTKNPEIAEVINEFGFKLLKVMLRENEYKNIVISPTGIASLLAMTLLGSTGETYEEIADLLGFSHDILKNRELHFDFGSRLHSLNDNTTSLYANAIFVDQLSELRAAFRSYLERVYHGEALRTDFGDVDKAKEMINAWVRNHTNNKIDNFLPQALPTSTKAVLLSTLYFKEQWAQPFAAEYTRQLPFQTPTKEVMIDLMANFGKFNYLFAFEDGLQIIEFPYNDNVTSMYVIKPQSHKHLNIMSLMDKIDYSKVDKLISLMSKKKCVVRFPKMDIENKIDLRKTLRTLGIQAMFTPGVANFAIMLESSSSMNETEEKLLARYNNGNIEADVLKKIVDSLANPGLHVDSVMHEVKININEFGTEAVAATSAVMARSAELFYVDSPFFMFIRNEKTKLVTFSAVLFDPTL